MNYTFLYHLQVCNLGTSENISYCFFYRPVTGHTSNQHQWLLGLSLETTSNSTSHHLLQTQLDEPCPQAWMSDHSLSCHHSQHIFYLVMLQRFWGVWEDICILIKCMYLERSLCILLLLPYVIENDHNYSDTTIAALSSYIIRELARCITTL